MVIDNESDSVRAKAATGSRQLYCAKQKTVTRWHISPDSLQLYHRFIKTLLSQLDMLYLTCCVKLTADDISKYLSYFSQKIDFDILPENRHFIQIINLLSAEFAHR